VAFQIKKSSFEYTTLLCGTMMSPVTPIVLMAVLCLALMTETTINRKRKVGGWKKVAVANPEVQEVAAKATAHIEKARNSAMLYRLQEVVSAKVQIEEGTKFELTLRIGQTNCLLQAKVDVKNCSIVKVERCSVTAYVSQGDTEIEKFSCKNEKKATSSGRQVPGGEIDVDVSRKDVQDAAIFATAEIARQTRHIMELVRVKKATSQIVAGVKFQMTMIVNITEKAVGKTEIDTCYATVWDQSWRTPRYILEKHKCLLG